MNRWYHPAFETDLTDAARYLDGQQPGLGVEFLDAAETAVETIMRSPHTWRARRDGSNATHSWDHLTLVLPSKTRGQSVRLT